MALKAVNEGELAMLERMIGIDTWGAGDTLRLWLYKEIGDSDATPKEGDSFANYVLTFGDSEKILLGDTEGWTLATGGGDTVSAVFTQQTFSFDSADSVAGYVITTLNRQGDTIIFVAEEFGNGPYVIPGGGGTVKVTPRIELE